MKQVLALSLPHTCLLFELLKAYAAITLFVFALDAPELLESHLELEKFEAPLESQPISFSSFFF